MMTMINITNTLNLKQIIIIIILEILYADVQCLEENNLCFINSFQQHQEYFFLSLDNAKCMQCHNDCLACFGENNNNCQSCRDQDKNLLENTCESLCPNGFFRDNKRKICQKCGKDCKECQNQYQCSKCNDNFYLLKVNQDEQFQSGQSINIKLLSENIQSEQIICVSKCNNGLFYDQKSQSCVRICPNYSKSNLQTMRCDFLLSCSEITDLNQVYHENYIWGIQYDYETGYFISYDHDGVILIWVQNAILVKKLSYHQSKILGISLFKTSQAITTIQSSSSIKGDQKIYRYLISFDESSLAIWDMKDFSLAKTIDLENNFKIRDSQSFIFDKYFIGLNKLGYYQKISFYTDYSEIFSYDTSDFGQNSTVAFRYTNGRQFLYDQQQIKVQPVDYQYFKQPTITCQKQLRQILNLYYEPVVNALFLYGKEGLNLIFLDSINQINQCFFDDFPQDDEGITHLITLNIKSLIVTFVDFINVNISQNGELSLISNDNFRETDGIIEFIVFDNGLDIWKYRLDCIHKKINRVNTEQVEKETFQNFWNSNEVIILQKDKYVEKDTIIFSLNFQMQILQLNSQLQVINNKLTVNPLNLYDIVKVGDKIIVYDVSMDIYNSTGVLEFVVQSLIYSKSSKSYVLNYLQTKPNQKIIEPVYYQNYSVNIQGQFLQLWQIPSFSLKNQVLIPYGTTQLPFYYIIQNDQSPWNNHIIVSYPTISLIYNLPALKLIKKATISSIYAIQTYGIALVLLSDYNIYVLDISVKQQLSLIIKIKLSIQYQTMNARLYNQYIFYQDMNQQIQIYDISIRKILTFNNFILPNTSSNSSLSYQELVQITIINNMLLSLSSLNTVNMFDLNTLTWIYQINPPDQIIYLFGYGQNFILIFQNGHIKFFNSDNQLIKLFNKYDGYKLIYAKLQNQYLIIKSQIEALAIIDCQKVEILLSFYESTSYVQSIEYDEVNNIQIDELLTNLTQKQLKQVNNLIVLNKIQGGLSILDSQGNVISSFNSHSFFFRNVSIIQDLGLIIAIDQTSKVFKFDYPPYNYIFTQTKTHKASIVIMYLDVYQDLILTLSVDDSPQKKFYAQEYLRDNIIANVYQNEGGLTYFKVINEDKIIFFINNLNQIHFYRQLIHFQNLNQLKYLLKLKSYPKFQFITVINSPLLSYVMYVGVNHKQKYILLLVFPGQIVIIRYPIFEVTQIEYFVDNSIYISDVQEQNDSCIIMKDFDSTLYFIDSNTFSLVKKFITREFTIKTSFLIMNSEIFMQLILQKLYFFLKIFLKSNRSYSQQDEIVFWSYPEMNLLHVITDRQIYLLSFYKTDIKKNLLFQVIAPGIIASIDLQQFIITQYFQGIQGNVIQLEIDEEKERLICASTIFKIPYFFKLKIDIIIWQYNGEKLFILNHNSEIQQFIIDKGGGLIISYTDQGYIYFWDYQNGQLIIKLAFQLDYISNILLDQERNILVVGHQSGQLRFIDYEHIIRNNLINKDSIVTSSIDQYFTILGQNIIYYDSRSNNIIAPLQSTKLGLYVIESLGILNTSFINIVLFANNYKNRLYFKQNQSIYIYTFNEMQNDPISNQQIQIKDRFLIQIEQNNINGFFLFTQQERFFYTKDNGDIAQIVVDALNKTSNESILLEGSNFQNQKLIKLTVFDNQNFIFLLAQTSISITIIKISIKQEGLQELPNRFIDFSQSQDSSQIRRQSIEYYKYSKQEELCYLSENTCYKYLALQVSSQDSKGQNITQIMLYDIDSLQQISLNIYQDDSSINKMIIYQNKYLFVLRNLRKIDVYTLQNIHYLQSLQSNGDQIIQLSIVRQLFTPSDNQNKLRMSRQFLVVFNMFQLNIFRMSDLLNFWVFRNPNFSYISEIYILNDNLCVIEDKFHIIVIDIANKNILRDVNMYKNLKILSLTPHIYAMSQYFQFHEYNTVQFEDTNLQDEEQQIVLEIIFYDDKSIHKSLISVSSQDKQSCLIAIDLTLLSQNPLLFDNQLQKTYTQNKQFNIAEQTIVLFQKNLAFQSPFLGISNIITNLIITFQQEQNQKIQISNSKQRLLENLEPSKKQETNINANQASQIKYRALADIDFNLDKYDWPSKDESIKVKDLKPYGKYYIAQSAQYLSLSLQSLVIENYEFVVNKNLTWSINQGKEINERTRTKKLKMSRMLINQDIIGSNAYITNLDDYILVDLLIDGNDQAFTLEILTQNPLFSYTNVKQVVIEKLIIQNYNINCQNNLHYFFDIDLIKIHQLILRNNTIHISKLSSIQALFQFSFCKNVIIDDIQIYKNNIVYQNEDRKKEFVENPKGNEEDNQSLQQKFPIYLFSFNATSDIIVQNGNFYQNEGLQFMHVYNKLRLDKQLVDLNNVKFSSSNITLSSNVFYFTPITIQSAFIATFSNLSITQNHFSKDCQQFLIQSIDLLIISKANNNSISAYMNSLAQKCKFAYHMIKIIRCNLKITDSLISENETFQSPLNIYQSQFIIQSSKFKFNKNYRGSGGVATFQYCINSDNVDQGVNFGNISIFFSEELVFDFEDIKGISGNKDEIKNQLIDCELYNNTAPYFGGAINSIYSDFEIIQSNITKNSATIGGAIYYNQFMPNVIAQIHKKNFTYTSQNIIQDNEGFFYGKNIASYPVDLQITYDKEEFSHYPSGQPLMTYLKVSFVDEEGSIIKALDPSVIPQGMNEIKILASLFKIEIGMETNSNIKIDGNLIQEFNLYNSQTSSFLFNVTFTGIPLKNTQFYVRSLVLPRANYFLFQNDSSYNQNKFFNQKLIKYIPIQFRQCNRGEIFRIRGDQIECEPCPQGKYSLEDITQLNATQTCKKCPIEAVECAKDKIILKDGYWRENFYTDQILECENSPQNCVAKRIDLNNTIIDPYCIPGYRGPLCESCDYYNKQGYGYFSKASRYQCQKCLSLPIQIVLFFVKAISMMGYMGFTFYKLLYQQYQAKVFYLLKKMRIIFLNKSIKRDQCSFYSKVFIDYLQVLSFLNVFKLRQFLIEDLSEGLGNPIQSLYYNYNCFLSQNENSFIIEQRLIQCIVMPFCFLFILIFISAILKVLKYKQLSLQHHSINLILLIYFFMFPSTVQTMLRTLSCRKIGNKSYILSDVQFECMTPEHKRIIYTYIIPCLLIWVLVLPLVIIMKIKAHLKKINLGKNIRSRNIYDFIYSEYREHRYYWELVKLLKKGLIIVVLNYFESFPIIQGVLMSFIILTYLILIFNLKPHSNQYLNKLDKENNIIILICLQICIFHTQVDQPVLNNISSLLIWSFILTFIAKLCLLLIWNMILSNNKVLQFYLFCVKSWNNNVPLAFKIAHQITNINRVQKNWKKIYKLFSQSIEEKKKGELSTFQVIRMILYKKIDLQSNNDMSEDFMVNNSIYQKPSNLQLIRIQSLKKLSLRDDTQLFPTSKIINSQLKNIDESPYIEQSQDEESSNQSELSEKYYGNIQRINQSQKFDNVFHKMQLNHSNQLSKHQNSFSPTSFYPPLNESSFNDEKLEKSSSQNLQSFLKLNSNQSQNFLLTSSESPIKPKRKDSQFRKVVSQDLKVEMQNLSQYTAQLVEDSSIIPVNSDDLNISITKERNIKQAFSSLFHKKPTIIQSKDISSPPQSQ